MASSSFRLPRFYPILDTSFLRQRQFDVCSVAEELIAAGAAILQYRHKDPWTETEYWEAERVRDACAEHRVTFVLNDRADFARLLGAGLHVGQNDLPPVAARKLVEKAPMGFSTHNRRQLTYGDEEPVDYLSIGPIYPTTSKLKPDPVVGLAGLKALRPLTKKRVVAIGGITTANASAVMAAGADSVAVISGFVPLQADRSLLRELAREWMNITAISA